MKPYYDDGNGIVIYLGDCREILPDLPKVDLVLTDPPYGIGVGTSIGGENPSGMVKVGGKNLSLPKVIGDLMILESPQKKFSMKFSE